MKLVIYTLEDTINEFFSAHPNVTRKQCDELALALAGGAVTPVPIQGCFSYTVTAGDDASKIVQFRSPKSELNTAVLEKARQIHGAVVAGYTFHGKMADSLLVYVMDKLPGDTFVTMQFSFASASAIPAETDDAASQDELSPLSTLVVDLARFFAASWEAPQTMARGELQALHDDYEYRLDRLCVTLPPRFQANLAIVRAGLPCLFEAAYPPVLTHGDLSETNLLVDPRTGHLTGVIDWAESRVSPFGTALYGLENVLGYMNDTGWHYRADHEALRSLFWQTFDARTETGQAVEEKQSIQIARMLGLFLRYGFAWEEDGRGHAVVDEDSSSFRYLDLFCATEEGM